MQSSHPNENTVIEQRVTTIILVVLAICFYILRIISRTLKRAPLGIDDWTLALGLAFVIACAGINYASTYYGMGQHMAVVAQNPSNMIMAFKLLYVFEPLYITGAGVIKISVLLMYNRIFPVRYVRIGSYILGAITIAWVISVDLVAIFQCTPVTKAFNRMLPGHCIDLIAALIGNGVPNFVTDAFILALPGRCIWKLQASLWQRISIILVFLTGSFVVFASIYRFSLIFDVDMEDITFTLASAQTWCVVETCAGVISACLPTVVPLIKLITKGVISTTSQSRSKSNTYSESRSRSRNHFDDRASGVAAGGGVGGGGTDSTPLGPVSAAGRRSNGNFALPELSTTGRGSRGSHGMKSQGWTMITPDVDSD